MWAIGCLMFHMVSGYHPFKESTKVSILFRIFMTLGTPTLNMLEYPTLSTGCPYFLENMDKFPSWDPMVIEAFIQVNISNEARSLMLKML